MDSGRIQAISKPGLHVVNFTDWLRFRRVLVSGVLILSENNAFILPLRQILHIRRIADIIVQAEHFTVKTVMASVNINTAAEYMRLPIRYVFVGWQIGVIHLFLCHCFLLL